MILKSVPKYFGLIFILFVIPNSLSITTTHHDKPEDTKVPIMAVKMKESEAPFKHTINATLETSERQKRLLPYYNFYLEHDFNRPQPQTNYKSIGNNGQHYQIVPQKSTTFQQFHNKFTELINTNNNNNDGRQTIKYTPFSESNAIPGPFLPMRQVVTQNLQSQQVVPQVQQQESPIKYSNENFQITKVPNYSAIYDQLSQLKLQQQNLAQNYRFTNPQFITKPQIATFIPVREYQDEDYKTPAKTIVQTYTASTLEIPNNNEEFESLKSYDVNTYPAHQDHVLPANEEEQEQYYKDHKLMNPEAQKQVIQKPVVILRPKPRIVPQKYYLNNQNNQKPYIQPTKPIYFVQRKPYQKPTYNNYETLRLQPVRYENNIKYEYDDKPKAVQAIPKEPKYHLVNYNEENKQILINHDTPQKVNYIKYNVPNKFKQPPKYPQYIVNQKSPVKYSTIEDYENQDHPQNYIKPTYINSPKYEQQKFVPSPPIEENITPIKEEDNENSLSVILKKLQATNALPHTLTPDNIDNSIRTLVKILSSLKKKQKFSRPIVVPDESGEYEEDIDNEAGVGLGGTPDLGNIFPDTPEGGTPGKPGVDYPALATIPSTSFSCKTQRYKGFFGDPDTHCQVWHYCDLNGGQASFLCPNGTIFSQVALTCDWWYNVKCSNTPQLYVLNERLYKYILPLAPKFPEDYSGPLVDRYLALKFQEMEEKMKKERKKNKEDSSDEGEESKSEEESDDDDADELSRQERLKQERERAKEKTENIDSAEE